MNKVTEKHTKEERKQEHNDENKNEDKEVIRERDCKREVEPVASRQEQASPHQETDVLITYAEDEVEAENRQNKQEEERECLSESVDQRLHQAVIQLKMGLETVDHWICTGESYCYHCCCSDIKKLNYCHVLLDTGTNNGEELVAASDWVLASIHHLVDTTLCKLHSLIDQVKKT